jgi:hypothetical protein
VRFAPRFFAAACTALVCWTTSYAHPVLTFSVTSSIEPIKGVEAQKGAPQRASHETFPLIVTLGHQYLSVDAKDTRTIYDFEHFRLYQLNLADRSFHEFSLYADIGFRVLEFRNRLGLGRALTAGGVKTLNTETPLLEQLFSLPDGQSHAEIEARHSGTQTVYQWQTHTLASVSDRVRPLPSDYQAEYWRFLRYYAGGHPQIFEASKPLSGVPEVTSFVLTNFHTETRTMVLQNLAVMPDQPFSLEGFTRAAPQQEPYVTLGLVAPDAPRQLEERLAGARKDRDLAFAQGRYLDSMLAFPRVVAIDGYCGNRVA